MKQLSAWGVANPVFVNILFWIVIISGGVAAFTMVREVMPEFSVDIIQVTVPYPGAGPEEVEEGIALKLEDAIEGLEGIKNFHTTATEFVGTATIEVLEGYDVQKLKDEITDRVNAITTFPADAERPIITEITTRSPVLFIAIHGQLPERQLKELAEEVKDELMLRDEITQVSVTGAREYEISIELSDEKLRRYGLTFDQVSRIVREASQNWPGGSLRGEAEQLTLRTMARRYTGQEFGDIILLTQPDGASIRLRQVAEIHDSFVEDPIYARFNGEPAVLINVSKTNEEDALKIREQVQEYIDHKLRQLPAGVGMHVWFDSSIFITQRIDMLVGNGISGLIIVFLLLWLFLDLRLAIWCSLGIPVALAGALAIMGLTGQTINMISLFTMIMILGIIVDDAIVISESIYHRRRQGVGPADAAVQGAGEVAWPVFAAVTTTIVAFLPLFFIKGVMGKFIRVLPLVVCSALLVSLLEALMMLPSHLRDLRPFRPLDETATGLRRAALRLRHAFGAGLDRLIAGLYVPLMRHVLNWRYVTVAAAIAFLFLCLGVQRAGLVKFELLPDIDTDYLIAQVEFPSGTPLSITRQAVERMEQALASVARELPTASGEPMVEALFSISGASTGFNAQFGTHIGSLYVELLPTEQRGIFFQQIISRWEQAVGPIPGAVSVRYDTLDTGPGGKPIEVWLMGHDMDHLLAAADRLKARLNQFDGVYQVEDDYRPGKREVRARLKPEARNLGLTEEMLGRQLRQGFYGDEALRVQRGRDELRVWIRYPRDQRRSLGDIESIRIRTPDGREVPLAAVADLDVEQGYAAINRRNGMRRIAVTAEVDTARANAHEIVDFLESGYLADLMRDFPGLVASIEGQKRETQESLESLFIGFPLALLAIFLILATIFRSYAQPLVILVTIPFGLIGAVIGHMVMGYHLTMLSMFGMVALAGIVVNDAIVLIDNVNERIARGVPVFSALCEAGARRFRAIMLTSVTTSFGLAPLILEKSMQAQFLIPMAISISFGVAFATNLTLILIPCLLLILNDLRRARVWLFRGRLPQREEVEPAAARRIQSEADAQI
ncbi:MAG TPA: efflux RND transporter permease subunit [Candidatus Sumerlaeota bacterium]|nr:efflux RND transporter permease subunit [Candidatus Sumerlaeota bacterium]